MLRSGARLHITGYERDGERVRLAVDGGTVSVLADDLVAVEPEEHFAAVPVPPVTTAGTVCEFDSCCGGEAWRG